jgi:large subunit ribosomal protein L29
MLAKYFEEQAEWRRQNDDGNPRNARSARGLLDAADYVRELPDEDLVTRLREGKEELFNLRFQVATGQLDNNRRLHTVRRDIARIYTVMRERELGIVPAGVPGGAVEGGAVEGGNGPSDEGVA